MENAMKGWTKSDTTLIIQSLSKLKFEDLEKKLPTKTRKEIKEAVLFCVNSLADAPPKKTEEDMTTAEWEAFVINKHKTCELVLPPPNKAIPYMMKLAICLRELFHQMGNAFEGRPIVSDSSMVQVLRYLASDLQAMYDFCDGDNVPDIEKYNSLLASSKIPMTPVVPTPTATSPSQKQKEQEKKETKQAFATPSMYSKAYINNRAKSVPADNPPMYPQVNQNIPPHVFDAQVSNFSPPPPPPVSRPQVPRPATVTDYITTMNPPATSTINAVHAPSTNYGYANSYPQQVQINATNNLQPSMNATATNNLQLSMNATPTNNLPQTRAVAPPPYSPAGQTRPIMNAGPLASNYFQPSMSAMATRQYELINASANNCNEKYGLAQNNSYNPTNATIRPNYVGARERNFEPSLAPAGSRLEPPARHAGNGAPHAAAGPNKQFDPMT